MRFTRKKKIAAVVVLALVVVSAAVAAWFVQSLGTGAGKFGTLSAPTVSAHDGAFTGVADFIFPGTSGSIGFSIENNNPTALILTALAPNGPITGSGGTTCTSHVTFSSMTGLSVAVPVGVTLIRVPNALAADAATPSECQGTSLVLPVSAQFATP
jgi:hypothetical protein